jgi:hypothetical protein
LLFLASLALRLIVAAPVIASDVPLRGDENGYVNRATGARQIIARVVQGEGVSTLDVDRLYGRGTWGPLYPSFLGLGFYLFGEHVAVARLMVAIVSALTTPLLYLLAARISSPRAGLIAALIHLIYPSLVAFSHLLWSETFFIFLTLLAIVLATRLRNAADLLPSLPYAILTGFTLGMAGLVRPTIIPALFLLPLWVALNVSLTKLRAILPLVVILTCFITLWPWEKMLYEREGHFVFLATTSTQNFLRANQPEGVTLDDARALAAQNGLDSDTVMRQLALGEITGAPLAALKRGVDRAFRQAWAVDAHVLKQIRVVVYPPLPLFAVTIWYLVALVSFLLLVTFAGLGFGMQLNPLKNYSNLLLLLILANLLSAFVFGAAIARLTVVNVALMLPAAGHGIANRRRYSSVKHKPLTILLMLLPILLIILTLPVGFREVSSYYAPLVNLQREIFGNSSNIIDQFAIRVDEPAIDESITITVLNSDYQINQAGQSELVWEPSKEQKELRFVLFSHDAGRPARLRITSSHAVDPALLVPTSQATWQRWHPSGLEGIQLRWLPMTESITESLFGR